MSYNFSTLHRGEDNYFYVKDNETLKYDRIEPLFSIDDWDSAEAYKFANIRGYEPMTAKELETTEQQNEVLTNVNYFIEEKFDGTRALVYFFNQKDTKGVDNGYCRVFSRRISKKTGFYVENTDSLPQIREINIPELEGTILDGEMFIDGRPFKDVSSTLNCLWDKAIDRQIELGFITFHAFDILFYKGIDLRKMPLERRKVYLNLIVERVLEESRYIQEVKYYNCGYEIGLNAEVAINMRLGGNATLNFLDKLQKQKDVYPELYRCVDKQLNITPRAYYELIVATGGEGVIIKAKQGKYLHKRGWEYSKIKKFLTKDLILIGFSEPTREYQGKAPANWGYYENGEPVTKYYYNKQVGNMKLGVLISAEEYYNMPENKRGDIIVPYNLGLCELHSDFNNNLVMEVCECSGYSDEEREYFTRNKERLIGQVIEVKANEIMKDTGRLRHPRYLRQRFDKDASVCTWKEHIE